MSWNPNTVCMLTSNNHALIEAYKNPTQPIFPLPISFYIGMESHCQYRTNINHLKSIHQGHYHQDLLHIHHLLTLSHGVNNINHLVQAYTFLCYHKHYWPYTGACLCGDDLIRTSSEEWGEAMSFLLRFAFDERIDRLL